MLGKECRAVVLGIVVSVDGSYHLEVHRHNDEPRTQTFENAPHTATVNVMPYFQFDGAPIELEGPQFRVISKTGDRRGI
jgi:hypothetical protein